MPFEPLLAGYAGFVSLALAMKKHRPADLATRLPPPPLARALGWALLALSLGLAFWRLGTAVGPVAWTGQLCLAGAAFVLLQSWKPRAALALAPLALLGLALLAASHAMG